MPEASHGHRQPCSEQSCWPGNKFLHFTRTQTPCTDLDDRTSPFIVLTNHTAPSCWLCVSRCASQKLFQGRGTSARAQILAIPPQRPLEGLQGCPCPRGGSAVVALWVLLLCGVLLSIPLKLLHGSAPRGRFVTLPPPSPQLVPFPGSPFPHHIQEQHMAAAG